MKLCATVVVNMNPMMKMVCVHYVEKPKKKDNQYFSNMIWDYSKIQGENDEI